MNEKQDVQEDDKPKEAYEWLTREHLIEQLENTVNYFLRLPGHEQFSFVTNADLYHFMLLVLNIFKSKL